MCFSSYKNRELKVKLWWVRACKRKKSAVLVTFILFEGIFVKKLIKIIFSSITVQVLDKQLFCLLRFPSSYLTSESFPGIHLRVLGFNIVFITINIYGAALSNTFSFMYWAVNWYEGVLCNGFRRYVIFTLRIKISIRV